MGWGCSWYRKAEIHENLVRKPRGKHPLVEERRNNEENVKINF
jgi:hypothetical protein